MSSSISDSFIKRPVMTVLLSISAVFAGWFSFKSMSVSDLPDVSFPVIQVSVSYPGASPTIMASNCASPLEQQFMQIPGLDQVTSTNSFGYSSIILQFNLSKDIDAASTDVQAAIQRATGNLPVDLPSPPTYKKTNPNDKPIFYICVTSDELTNWQLYNYAYTQIAQQMNLIEGVSQVDTYGSPKSVRVEVDPKKLYSLGLTMDDLNKQLSQTTNMYSAGNLDGKTNQFLLFPDTQLSSAEDYKDIIISWKDGAPLYLRDVATVIDYIQTDTLSIDYYEKGKEPSKSVIILAINKAHGGNTVTISKDVLALMQELKTQMPETMELSVMHNSAEFILQNIADVEETLIIAFILVVLVIFLFLGRIRDTAIPAVALPLSMLLTFVAMKLLGFSVNNLTLLALILAIGFLVDDAIVFLENVVRRMQDFGESTKTATFRSAREISFTILSMTLSLAVVFLPLAFMSGILGRSFQEFALTIMVATLMSGVVSLTVTPMLCARIIASRTNNKSDKTAVERFSEGLEHAFLRFYNPSLRFFLKRHVAAFLITAGSIFGLWFYVVNLPFNLLPVGDSGFVFGAFITDTNVSNDKIDTIKKDIALTAINTQGMEKVLSISGIGSFMSSNMGIVVGVLEPVKDRQDINIVTQNIYKNAANIPGGILILTPQPTLEISSGATSTTQGKYAYSLIGMDANEVYEVAQKMMGAMYQKMGTMFSSVSPDFFLDNPQVTLQLDRNKASAYGVSANAFSEQFKQAYSKGYYYLIKDTSLQYWSIMEAAHPYRDIPENLELLYFDPLVQNEQLEYSDLPNLIPFNSIASTKQVLTPLTVNHTNNLPSATLYFNLKEGVAISQAMEYMNSVATQVVPRTIQGAYQGEAISTLETVQSLLKLAVLAIFVMYVILGILYESYVHPITVLSSLPIALVGGVAALYYLNMDLSVYSIIGLFMLMGIVKKNGILIVDFALDRQDEGMSPQDAVHEACMERFRPIIMTSMAAFMGMVPIALGMGEADAKSRIPLGVVVVAGLIFSQAITLYVTPVIYLWFNALQTKVLDKIPLFQRGTRYKPQIDENEIFD